MVIVTPLGIPTQTNSTTSRGKYLNTLTSISNKDFILGIGRTSYISNDSLASEQILFRVTLSTGPGRVKDLVMISQGEGYK